MEVGASRCWHGQLHLNFEREGSHTRQRVIQVQAPLKVQRAFYGRSPLDSPSPGVSGAVLGRDTAGAESTGRVGMGGAGMGRDTAGHFWGDCQTVALHTAGGLVGGDRLTFKATWEPHTASLITTAAATKVYGSGESGRDPQDPLPPLARQDVHLSLATGSHGEWLPQETIVFAGANYAQTLRVDLAAGATWLGWDITRLGRSARREEFRSGRWRSQGEVWRQGVPLWIDPQGIEGCGDLWDSPQALAQQPVIATLAWVGQPVSPDLVAAARSRWHDRPEPTATAQGGVTRLMEGLLCRYRGPSTAEARSWFVEVWRLVRRDRQGPPPAIPRVWPL